MVPFREYEKMLEDEQRAAIEIQQERINDRETQLTDWRVGIRNSTSPFEGEYDSLGRYEKMGLELGKLVDKKQLAYGDAMTVCQKVIEVHLENTTILRVAFTESVQRCLNISFAKCG